MRVPPSAIKFTCSLVGQIVSKDHYTPGSAPFTEAARLSLSPDSTGDPFSRGDLLLEGNPRMPLLGSGMRVQVNSRSVLPTSTLCLKAPTFRGIGAVVWSALKFWCDGQ